MADDKNSGAKIGLIAGNRLLPFQFVKWAKRNHRDIYIVGIKGETDEKLKAEVSGEKYSEFYITEITKIIKYFKQNGVVEVVMIGGIANSKFKLTFDLIKLVLRLLFMKNKHKGIFVIVLSIFDKSGLRVRSIQELMPELLIGEGALGNVKPTADDISAFHKNFGIISKYIRTGNGQAVIIYKGEILAFEDFRGTDDLANRAIKKRSEMGGERGGIMAKIMEPGQDERADLPVVGTGTVETLAKYGIDGVVIEAGRTIVDDMADTIKIANEKGVFIYGIKLP